MIKWMLRQFEGVEMQLKPIKTEEDYEEALAKIDELWEAEPDTPDGDLLDLLTMLVEAYEEKQHPILPPDPVEAILHLMESQGLERRDLIPYLGSRARVSEVINRKRPLSLNMIRKLQAGLGISAEILVHPYELQP